MNDTDSLLQYSKQYPAGAVLLREGEAARDMFILLQGSIGAYKDYGNAGQVQLNVYEAGSFLGEMDFFLDEPPKATVVALTHCIVLAIGRQNIYSFFADQPGMTFTFIQSLCLQLAKTNENYRMLYERYTAEVAAAGGGLAQETGKINQALADPAIQTMANPKPLPEMQPESVPLPEMQPGPRPVAEKALAPVAEPKLMSAAESEVEQAQQASAPSSLFPPGHGSYLLPIDNKKDGLLFERETVCPVCGHKFNTLSLFMSKLRLERNDMDMRPRYKDIEPMHYDVITGPACCYSACADSFAGANKRQAEQIAAKVGAFCQEGQGLAIKTGYDRDTFTVFAGYYLALLCAPVVAGDYQLTTAKLWLRLARIYEDCGDENMRQYANQMALADYTYAYEGLRLSEKQSQQLCFVIGDLYYKMGNLENARTFLHYAKMNKDGSQAVKRQADTYLYEVREEIKSLRRNQD